MSNLDPNKFSRSINNLVRGKNQMILNQADRMIFSTKLMREVSQEINKLGLNQYNEIADILETAHIAQESIKTQRHKSFISEFIPGDKNTLVKKPDIKQDLDNNLEIRKRIQLGRSHKRTEKRSKKEINLVKKFVKDFNLPGDLIQKKKLGTIFKPKKFDIKISPDEQRNLQN